MFLISVKIIFVEENKLHAKQVETKQWIYNCMIDTDETTKIKATQILNIAKKL